MGRPMAGHLLAGGHGLTVYSRTKAKADELLRQGAKWADTPADAAAVADVVFICVPDTPDVENVLFAEEGVAHAARRGLIVVDHSTISPSATRGMARRLAENGAALLDAPVSGGDMGAKNASLSIMVGGDPTAFSSVLPLFRLMGKTITHCGPSGTGQLTKLVNQILVTINNMAACEALAFAQVNGLDLSKTLDALGGGAAASWQWNHLGPKMVAGDFSPGFMVDLQLKDLNLVIQAMRETNLDLPAARLVYALFVKAQQQGYGRDGTQRLFTVVRD